MCESLLDPEMCIDIMNAWNLMYQNSGVILIIILILIAIVVLAILA